MACPTATSRGERPCWNDPISSSRSRKSGPDKDSDALLPTTINPRRIDEKFQMQRKLLLPILLTLSALIGCTSNNQVRKTDQPELENKKANTAYCPVNLYDNRDVLSCFDTRELCERSISKAPKYTCYPRSSLKYPPKK